MQNPAARRDYRLRQEFITPYTPEQNGMIERFFRSLKGGCVWQQVFVVFTQARRAIRVWIRWYNKEPPHQSLSYILRRRAGLNNHNWRLEMGGALHAAVPACPLAGRLVRR